MNVVEFSEDVRCLMGERELQFEDRGSNSLRPEAAPGSLDNKVPKRGGVRYVNDAEERLHPEEWELSSKLPLAKQLRLSMLLIREQERELSEVTKELKARREVSLLLKERLEVLLGRGHPATSKGHGLRQGLAEGLRLAEQLVHILNPDQSHSEGGSAVEPEAPRFIVQHLTLDLKPIKQFEKWRDIIFSLRQSLNDLLTQDGPARHQGQSHRENHAEWLGLAKKLALQLGPEHHCEGDGEEEMQSLDCSVELCEEEVDELLSEPVEELHFLSSGRPDAPHPQEHLVSAAVPADEPEVSSAPDGTKAEDIEKPQEEEEASEVPRDFSSAIELQAQVWTHLRKTFRKWRDTILFFRRSIRDLLSREDPVRREGQRQQGHAEWCKMAERLALQLGPELNLDPSLGLKNPPKVGDDATHGTQAHGLTDAAAAQKQTIIKRKPWFWLGKMACRFLRPRASGGEVPPAASNKDAAHLRGLVIRDRPALYSDV
ncbi:NBPF family member NBPF11-like isoform 1-T2 [Erethizon dorsatum]